MKAEEKAEWVAALRSGDYTQGHSRLRTGNAFCCLGVKADLEVRKDNGSWLSVSGSINDAYFYLLEENLEASFLGYLPVEVFPEHEYVASGDEITIEERLVYMNDNGYSLSEIADWIEQNIPTEV